MGTGSAPVMVLVNGWQGKLEVPIRAYLEHLGNTMTEESVAICPVDTGRLEDSIKFFIEGRGLKSKMWFGATAPYAYWVEMGHHTVAGTWVPAQPFIRPVVFKYATQSQAA
jgi:hypothetical protein